MKRFILMAMVSLSMMAGCAAGRPLSLSGGLLPAGRIVPEASVLPRVAVLDFDYSGGEQAVIGRDYDGVRSIVWKGSPGSALADVVAASLAERGVPVVRVALAGHVPAGVLVTVRGRIEDFRVNAKRIHSVKVEFTAHVGLTLQAEGEGVSPGWSSGSLESDVEATEPFFVTPDGVQEALRSAANGVCDEGAKRLMALPGVGGAPAPR